MAATSGGRCTCLFRPPAYRSAGARLDVATTMTPRWQSTRRSGASTTQSCIAVMDTSSKHSTSSLEASACASFSMDVETVPLLAAWMHLAAMPVRRLPRSSCSPSSHQCDGSTVKKGLLGSCSSSSGAPCAVAATLDTAAVFTSIWPSSPVSPPDCLNLCSSEWASRRKSWRCVLCARTRGSPPCRQARKRSMTSVFPAPTLPCRYSPGQVCGRPGADPAARWSKRSSNFASAAS
mmetsp:Transcript_54141/g.152544  ORF Transcript_54141/g.152544 Transcript_54141/m.152544 type:complete len:235 (+) Transcript_54141:562-1266(+)